MTNIISLIYSDQLLSSNFESVYKENKGVKFYGVPSSASSFLASVIYTTLKDQFVLVIASTNTEAEFLYRESLSYLAEEDICYFPGPEVIPYDYSHMSPEVKRDRIRVLSRILSGQKAIIFTSTIGFLHTVPTPKSLKDKSFSIFKDQELSLKEFTKKLVRLGYEREEVCEQFGQFSIKGGLVDVFTTYASNPIRVDFFGDTIDEIKLFDPNTQKSVETLERAYILPFSEFVLSEEEREEYFKKIIKNYPNLKKPESEIEHGTVLEELVGLVRKPSGFLSYFPQKPCILFYNQSEVIERALHVEREYKALYEKRKDEIICLPPEMLLSLDVEKQTLESKKEITSHLIIPSELKKNEFNLNLKDIPSFRGKISEVREKIQELQSQENPPNIVITSSYPAQRQRLASLFGKQKITILNPDWEEPFPFFIDFNRNGELYLVLSELRNGFYFQNENLYIWSDNDIFGRSYKRKTRFKRKSSRVIDSFIDLKEGDYVVHINHGVGRFLSIEKVTANGKVRDFLKLEYNGGDTLFVPLDQISLVQRYIGGTDRPSLDSLGKNIWKKKKERAQESVDRLANELLLMYSNRMKLQGYAFPSDTIWQEEFEAEFEYEETPDQLTAIESVKADLESQRPMDRLVCGDVGYGKTEVAIRGAFKVVMAGKQVLLIAPTTILALQHYNTLTNRFANYPIKVDMVSRFRTPKETKTAISNFSKGEIDILVGTHALLTGSLKPKNLGLLIIDEEQRFGVNHKEAIKKLKNLVDVLTLSATPIPRTLHMSLVGIRDLSIIETPPKNRQSVETYVMEDNEEIIKTAIDKELERGGQVFYLYNKVESIEQEANRLSQILPEISIGILHGQLSEDEIEETLMDFYNKKYEVLVTTTIIESGIDMPNVNTMIVQRADTFGLSQLYQIRGRVGRSGRKAYAYLFYPPDRSLTEQAEKRLNTIQEYQELGSGFKVAMKDLEIRGAGNLLGKEQSGEIMDIGFDLYVQMLNEAVSRLRGDEIEVEVRTAINLATNFYIPDNYIQDTRQKIELYKKFEAATDWEEIDNLTQEMEDRFGKIPEEAKVFIILERIRTIASQLGFESITSEKDSIKLKSGPNFKGDFDKIIQLIASNIGLSIHPQEPNILRYKFISKDEKERLDEILFILQKL